MSGVTAAAMVCAGLLSVVLFPAAALALLRKPDRPEAGNNTSELSRRRSE